MANDIKTVTERIGRNIKSHRESCGLTQVQLSLQVGMHDEYLSQIERGVHYPSIKKLCLIADILKIEVWELLK